MRESIAIARDVARDVVTNGGATVSAFHGVAVPSTGYVVADGRHERTVRLEGESSALVETVLAHSLSFVRDNRATLAWVGYVGAWVDNGSSLVLDIVEIVGEREHALNLARQRGEQAIYDLATGDTLYV